MAASATVAEITHTSVRKITWTWTSAADGSVSKVTAVPHAGRCIGLATIPAAAGSAPTDNYDITITDADGHDILMGAGANRDTLNTEYVVEASLAGAAGSLLTLNVTNAGDTKGGTVILWIR